MKLELTTFGNSPAAQYLVQLLNEKQDTKLARKVGKILSTNRETLNDLESANANGYVSLRTLNRQIEMISGYNHSTATAPIAAADPHLAHLVLNVLEGGVKSMKRRAQIAATNRRNGIRGLPPGEAPLNYPIAGIADDKTAEVLQARSKAYLARHNKLDTLY